MSVAASYQATLRVIPSAVNVTPQTVVALPPSHFDGAGLLRKYVDGVLVELAYDVDGDA